MHDYLITDETWRVRWKRRSPTEKLLLSEEADELHLALYLDAGLLERLAERDPLEELGPGNLEDFCKVLEGLSHFNYLTWNATDRRVTMLELELQAEVDKIPGRARWPRNRVARSWPAPCGRYSSTIRSSSDLAGRA